MPPVDEQLVRRIAQQVIAQLNANGVTSGAAPIHPPIGVCTGDYSQFTDRPDLVAGGASAETSTEAAPSNPAPAVPAQSRPPALSGFITGRHIDAVEGDTVYLAAKARLTPLAADRVKERGLKLHRVSAETDRPALAARKPWLWWIDGNCPAARQIVGDVKLGLTPVAQAHDGRRMHEAIARIAQQVKQGQAPGAILFVPTAARAACYANRCPSLRAVVGTCPDAARQGVEQLGANVLIIEYPYHGPGAMRSMIGPFITAQRAPLGAVDRHLKELGTCV